MARSLLIPPCEIRDDGDCYVIAEIGHNHQGSLKTARELIAAAKQCGANAVKLQKRDNHSLYTRAMYQKPYRHKNSFGATYGEHRQALEFGEQEYGDLQCYAREIGISLFATAFDLRSADFLAELCVPAFKVASGDLTNTPLLKHVAGFQKPMLVSTGGGSMDDVQRAHDTVMPINPRLCLLQCTSGYPCVVEEMNLRVISSYRERFPDVVVGLSAHDDGIAMATAAYALGARVLEKHFTLNRGMKGTDHAFSLEPPGLRMLVRDLQRLRLALGDGNKRPYDSEKVALYKMQKKLVASRNLPTGHALTYADVAIKSPNDGLPPYQLERVLGLVTVRPLKEDEAITADALSTQAPRTGILSPVLAD